MAEPLVAPQLQDDHQLLVSATREAGAIALGYFNGSVKSWDKKPDDPVSEADLEIDRLLKGKLLGQVPTTVGYPRKPKTIRAGLDASAHGWLTRSTAPGGFRQGRVCCLCSAHRRWRAHCRCCF